MLIIEVFKSKTHPICLHYGTVPIQRNLYLTIRGQSLVFKCEIITYLYNDQN